MHGNATLNDEQIAEIRTMDASGHLYQTEIAKIFGVHPTTVNKIVLRHRRKI